MTKDTEALRTLVNGIILTASPESRHCGMTLDSDEVELLAQHFRSPDTIGSHSGNGGGFDPSAELGFDPTAEVGDEVFPHDAGESAPVAWMLRSNETGEVIFDEVCVWRDRESAEDAVAEIDPELMEYSADAVPFPLYAHPPHPAPVDPVAGGEADTIIAKLDFKMLREAVSGIADDWMSSKEHHQGWVLIPIDKFSKLRVADRIMKMRGNNAALKGPAA